jgi:multicomponent K+:H+ antiporter subunit E
MKRWVPFPLLSLFLLALWLLLNQTLAAGDVLLGIALALGGGRVFGDLQPQNVSQRAAPFLRNSRVALGLAVQVLGDIVRSNIAVGRIVLQPGLGARTSGFVDIPLELRNQAGLAVLACIVTATPGTAWARYDRERGILTLHILDLIDEQVSVRTIKEHYEKPLREIFE